MWFNLTQRMKEDEKLPRDIHICTHQKRIAPTNGHQVHTSFVRSISLNGGVDSVRSFVRSVVLSLLLRSVRWKCVVRAIEIYLLTNQVHWSYVHVLQWAQEIKRPPQTMCVRYGSVLLRCYCCSPLKLIRNQWARKSTLHRLLRVKLNSFYFFVAVVINRRCDFGCLSPFDLVGERKIGASTWFMWCVAHTLCSLCVENLCETIKKRCKEKRQLNHRKCNSTH